MTLFFERELIREVALVGALAWFLAAGVVFVGGPGPDWKWWLKLAVTTAVVLLVGVGVYYSVGPGDSTPPGSPTTTALTTVLDRSTPPTSPLTAAVLEHGGPFLEHLARGDEATPRGSPAAEVLTDQSPGPSPADAAARVDDLVREVSAISSRPDPVGNTPTDPTDSVLLTLTEPSGETPLLSDLDTSDLTLLDDSLASLVDETLVDGSSLTTAAIDRAGPALVDEVVREVVVLSPHFADCDPNLIRQVLADPARAARAEEIYDYFAALSPNKVTRAQTLADALYADQVRFAHRRALQLLSDDRQLFSALRHVNLPDVVTDPFKLPGVTSTQLGDFALHHSAGADSWGSLSELLCPEVLSEPISLHIVEAVRAAEEAARLNVVELNGFARLFLDPPGDRRFFRIWGMMVKDVLVQHKLPQFSAEGAQRHFTDQLQYVLSDGGRRLRSVALELALAGQPVPTDSMMLASRARLFDLLHTETYKMALARHCAGNGLSVADLAANFHSDRAFKWITSVFERHGNLPGFEPVTSKGEWVALFREASAKAVDSVSSDDFQGYYRNLQKLLVEKAQKTPR